MNKTRKTNSDWPRIRKLFNDLHLWGGLISGIIVFIVCLTGTIYVYNNEIREAAAPEYYTIKPVGNRIAPDSLYTLVRPQIKGKVVGIKIPHAAHAPVAFLFMKPDKEDKEHVVNEQRGGKQVSRIEPQERKNGRSREAGRGEGERQVGSHGPARQGQGPQGGPGGGGRRPRFNQMVVNPYSGELIGDVSEVKTKTADFMQTMFGLHRWLLLNEIDEPIISGIENRKLGSWITGTATLLFLFGVISGMVIWFPNKMRSWKNGLKIKWSAKWKRVNHDLHNTLGFYSCIILLLMSVTGPFWSFDWYRIGWQKAWGTYQPADAPREEKAKLVSAFPTEGQQPLTIAQIQSIADQILIYEGDLTINFAVDSNGAVAITKSKTGFFAPAGADKLTIDQYTGKILEKEIFGEKPFNERASASIKALHIGDVYGSFTKLLYFLACLIATSLPVTGILIWINKMKKKPTSKRG